MSNPVISWAKDNPVMAGGIAVAVVVVAMLLTSGGSNGEGDATQGSGGVSAYYNAVANQAQAGAAVQIEQIKAGAATSQTLAAASYAIERDKLENQTAQMIATQEYGTALWSIDSNERMNYVNNETTRYGITQSTGVQLWAIDAAERMNYINNDTTRFNIATNHAISDNTINLANNALHSSEIVASINAKRDVGVANAGGQSVGSQIAGVIGSIGSAAKSILPFV